VLPTSGVKVAEVYPCRAKDSWTPAAFAQKHSFTVVFVTIYPHPPFPSLPCTVALVALVAFARQAMSLEETKVPLEDEL
jgi:hypothetical protein